MKKLLTMIGAAGCLALEAFADTTASYTAGDTSLANGKITFEYDGSDNITKMRMKPDYGETLTLTGDALSFADGAQLITSQQGTPVIANTVSAAGSLRLGSVTNMTYQGGYDVLIRKNNTSWTTLFPNTHLDDISPVSAAKTGRHSTGVSIVSYPYWVVRENDTLRAEFQCADVAGNAVYAVWLEARQNGSNVEGRILRGGYKTTANNYTNYVGISMFEHDCIPGVLTTNNTIATEYGLSQITFGPRRDVFGYNGELLAKDADTPVATDVSLDDIEVVYGAILDKTAKGWPQCLSFEPRNIKRSEGMLSCWFTRKDGTTVKGVRIELRQSGANVVARNAAAYSIDGEEYDEDYDFDNGGGTARTVATADNYNATKIMYGIDTLVLRSKAKDNLTFKVNGTMDVPAVAGNDVAVTFEAASASATVNAAGANTMTNSAYIIKGDADHAMVFNVNHEDALPDGTTDAWGQGTVLNLATNGGMGSGVSDGNSEITMHPGSKLETKDKTHAFLRGKQVLTLDAAELEVDKVTYVPKTLTLANGSTVSGSAALSAVYDLSDVVVNVTGTGASAFGANVTLYGKDISRRWTIDVEDTVAGDAVDFTMNGNITPDSTHNKASIRKTGPGTMLMNGTMSYVVSNTEIVEGALCLGVSGAVASGGSFSLEGGTLGLAAGTANTCASIAVTEDSTLSVGAGATLTIGDLTVAEGKTLAIVGDAIRSVKVNTALDDDTLSRITVNGKAAYQSDCGYFSKNGLIILFR